MKVSDLIADELCRRGVKHVFGLTGGAVVHLFDAVARSSGIKPVFHHHEQAGAFAAVANGRVGGGVGVGIFTTGPGGLNALSPLAGAWMDSIPCLFLSGQTRREHCSGGTGTRQVGTQEFDIVNLVKPMSKRAVMLDRPEDVLYELDLAFYEATYGRPGPVWLDIPLNFQWAEVNPATLRRFIPPTEVAPAAPDLSQIVGLLQQARRPLLVLGNGINGDDARANAERFLRRLQIPYVATYNSFGYWPSDDPLNVGVLGLAGHRGANLAVQNCDFLLAVGSHLCISQTGTLFDKFSPNSKHCVVNIDPSQLAFETVRVDHKVCMDGGEFFARMSQEFADVHDICWDSRWIELVGRWVALNREDIYKVDPASAYIDQYVFVRAVGDKLAGGENVVVDGGGTNVYISFQAFRVKARQRVVLSSGLASMGSGLPEAIGAAFANGARTICFVGDGSFMLNIQELATIRHHRLPLKVFVFNNGGYVSIRETQAGFLDGRFFGTNEEGGVWLPSAATVAESFGIPAITVSDQANFAEALDQFLESEGPGLCEVMISPKQAVRPRQGFRSMESGAFSPVPLDNMFPHLSDVEHSELSPWTQA